MAGTRTTAGKVNESLEAALAAATGEPETVDNRPGIARLFDKMGLKVGARLGAIHTSDGKTVTTATVRSASVIADGGVVDAVLELSEDGTRNIHFVVWSKVVDDCLEMTTGDFHAASLPAAAAAAPGAPALPN